MINMNNIYHRSDCVSKDLKRVKKSEKKKKKLDQKEIENDFLLFCFLLSTFAMLTSALQKYSFPISGYSISFSIIIFPSLIFISNYITKKFGFKRSFLSIVISSLVIIAFVILIQDLLGKRIDLIEIGANCLSSFVSLIINLWIYYYIVINIEPRYESIWTYIGYIFAIAINHIIFMLFSTNMVVVDHFWISYFISIIIEAIVSILFVYFDHRIKRGI